MKSLLSARNAGQLARLASRRSLLAFDFDGTLAPVVARRDDARMRDQTASLFRALCGLYPCAVVSGRSVLDVSPRLDGAAVRHVVGNHGLEPGRDLARFERQMGEARRLLGEALAREPGVELEDKRYSLAIHFRASPRRRNAREAACRAVAALPEPVRLVPGKMVLNLVPEHAPDKGSALLALVEAEQAEVALYAGDDVTDEDVFKLDQPGRLISVRVGASRASFAPYFLPDQGSIDLLLARLIALRTEPGGAALLEPQR